jgi:hypothetical protein
MKTTVRGANVDLTVDELRGTISAWKRTLAELELNARTMRVAISMFEGLLVESERADAGGAEIKAEE